MSHAYFDIAFLLILYWEFFCSPQGNDPCIFDVFRDSIVKSHAHPWSISLLMAFSNADEFISEWYDL